MAASFLKSRLVQITGRRGFELEKKRRIFAIVTFIFVLSITAGCSQKTSNNKTDDINKDGILIIDNAGREIRIDGQPQRIISLSPSNTEILYALGIDDKIVGVTEYCDYPEQAKAIEKIGGFANPNIEKIVSHNPDLVIANDIHQEAVEDLERLGFPVIILCPKNIYDMLENIKLLGKALGREGYADELVESLNGRIEAVQEKVSAIPEAEKPKVYYEIWHEPLMTAGPGTFIDDLLTLAGGINIARETKTTFPEISLELIIQKAPDIFIYSHHGDSHIGLEEIYARHNWQDVPAIKNKQVYVIDSNIVQRATPRLVDGLEEITKILHPHLFK